MTEVSFPGLGITMNIKSIAFSLFGIDVYWYGIIIALGIALCIILAMKDCKKCKFSQELISDLILVALPSAIVGARLYYVVCEWDYYKGDLKRIFDTRSGGLAVYGGIIAAFLGVFIACKIRKISFAACIDFAIPYIPLGQAIGRWGNFFNQEAFGTTTNLPWGMTSSKVVDYLSSNCPDLDSSMPVHPTFLYESLFNICLFFILLQIRKRSKHDFETTCGYCIGYGLARFLIEGLRTDSLYIGNTNIRTSQLLSLVLVVFGICYVIFANVKNTKKTWIPEKLLETNKSLLEEVKEEDNSKTSEETPNIAEVTSEVAAAIEDAVTDTNKDTESTNDN